jgi:protein O-mannosyl-transferase
MSSERHHSVLKSRFMTVAEPDTNIKGRDLSIFQSPEKVSLIMGLLLILVTLALYNPVSHAPFLNYDDDYYIIQNPHVRAGLSWKTVQWAFQSSELANWHPITWLSHATDIQLFGLNPSGHHYMNLLLQATNVLLLFLFLKRSTGALWRSFFVAALFAVHPVNVESVAWISERKNVLSMMFFLLGLIAYAGYTRSPSISKYLRVAVCFALGLMAKPQVITFPFVLLLLDYWPLRRIGSAAGSDEADTPAPQPRPWATLVFEKVPLLLMSAASAVITMKVQTEAMHTEFPLWERLANAALAYVRYLGKLLWPVNLAPMYPHPEFLVSKLLALIAVLALVTCTLLIVKSRRPYLLVGWFWFLGTLVPMIGLVQVGVQAMADRYAYIPFIGIFVLIVWGAAELLQKMRVPQLATSCAMVALLLLFALLCHRQLGYWNDNLTLWTHTLAVTHDNFVAEDSLAMALVVQGKPTDGNQHFENALKINPKDAVAHLNIGVYEQQRADYQSAIEHYQSVLRYTRTPQLLTSALANLGYANYELKQFTDARRAFEAALQIHPENSKAVLGLGLLDQRAGEFSHAANEYAQSVQLLPTDVGYLLLAEALEASGQPTAALSARAQAEHISRDLDRARQTVTKLLAE